MIALQIVLANVLAVVGDVLALRAEARPVTVGLVWGVHCILWWRVFRAAGPTTSLGKLMVLSALAYMGAVFVADLARGHKPSTVRCVSLALVVVAQVLESLTED